MRRETRLTVIAAVTASALAGSSGTALAAQTDDATPISSRSQAGYSTGSSPFGSSTRQPAAEDCGVRVDLPHPSRTTNNQIHTRVESFCNGATIVNNTISGKSYRSRWYGWEHMKSETNGPKSAWRVRVTVDVNCEYGTWHRWRTEGFGSGVLNGQPVSASAYEENNDEIMCGANN
ncbi:hypothetical protein [Streptomyces sp. MNU89]|uniref:hypothetical protein n=1 Tax=Streptomyces sp. MNU89 TaxID=2560025 RepID=UPI001E5B0085|nr:hypothetical protein [Streptomyces sp. MNU89]MCC9740958.1 hypothetical protein [Streptomyces sp. MNU89]